MSKRKHKGNITDYLFIFLLLLLLYKFYKDNTDLIEGHSDGWNYVTYSAADGRGEVPRGYGVTTYLGPDENLKGNYTGLLDDRGNGQILEGDRGVDWRKYIPSPDAPEIVTEKTIHGSDGGYKFSPHFDSGSRAISTGERNTTGCADIRSEFVDILYSDHSNMELRAFVPVMDLPDSTQSDQSGWARPAPGTLVPVGRSGLPSNDYDHPEYNGLPHSTPMVYTPQCHKWHGPSSEAEEHCNGYDEYCDWNAVSKECEYRVSSGETQPSQVLPTGQVTTWKNRANYNTSDSTPMTSHFVYDTEDHAANHYVQHLIDVSDELDSDIAGKYIYLNKCCVNLQQDDNGYQDWKWVTEDGGGPLGPTPQYTHPDCKAKESSNNYGGGGTPNWAHNRVIGIEGSHKTPDHDEGNPIYCRATDQNGYKEWWFCTGYEETPEGDSSPLNRQRLYTNIERFGVDSDGRARLLPSNPPINYTIDPSG